MKGGGDLPDTQKNILKRNEIFGFQMNSVILHGRCV